ncbi:MULTISPECIES: hypothetical protein [Actinosynnema]|nr:hypothetical protein [Actinosynnema pretiosum]
MRDPQVLLDGGVEQAHVLEHDRQVPEQLGALPVAHVDTAT